MQKLRGRGWVLAKTNVPRGDAWKQARANKREGGCQNLGILSKDTFWKSPWMWCKTLQSLDTYEVTRYYKLWVWEGKQVLDSPHLWCNRGRIWSKLHLSEWSTVMNQCIVISIWGNPELLQRWLSMCDYLSLIWGTWVKSPQITSMSQILYEGFIQAFLLTSIFHEGLTFMAIYHKSRWFKWDAANPPCGVQGQCPREFWLFYNSQVFS